MLTSSVPMAPRSKREKSASCRYARDAAKTTNMSIRIEDYALIGNTYTAALVGRDGSIDWLCMPRFDSGACFATLLGTADNGRWLIAPAAEVKTVRRKYRGDTLVLETEFELAGGERVAIIDFMPICEREGRIDLIRIIEGRRGTVPMQMEAVFRFDYGRIIPWVRRRDYGISAVAGPDALQLRTPVQPPRCRNGSGACATGITATAGCATQPLRSTRC